MTSRYTFGTSDTAADRLEVLARVFAPTTRAFLWSEAPWRPRLAVDLGCGPGRTTALVATATRAERTVGLERSAEMAGRADPEVEVLVHDALDVPFPVGPADLVYCRYLLSHLADPAAALAAWATQLAPGGRLLVEEVEAIATTVEPFAAYLGGVAELLAANGQTLAVGPVLAAAGDPPGLRRVSNKVAILQPPAGDAVAMFRPNLATWRHDPSIEGRWSAAELDDLDRSLAALVDLPAGGITWRLRQIAWERAEAVVRGR